MVRPSTDVPLSLLIACSASSGVAISTKPKPRERPVSRSVTTAADSTVPVAAKTSRRRSLEVEKDSPPTKSLTAMGRAPLVGNPEPLRVRLAGVYTAPEMGALQQFLQQFVE